MEKSKILMVVMIIFLASCQKIDRSTIIEEYNVNSFTRDYTVQTSHWQVGTDDESGIYYYYEFRENNLTQFIYDHGIMQAFLITNNANLTPLPFDDFWMEGDYRWTEQVTCEFRPGYVTFILKYNDHATNPPYYVYDFRVRFLW